MKLNRNLALKIHYILDQLLPPVLRDSKYFVPLLLKIPFGKKAEYFLNFKEKAPFMSEKQFMEMYVSIKDVIIERETDLNNACVDEIFRNIAGESILEAGCGKAFLSDKLENAGYKVTAIDIYIRDELKKLYPRIIFNNGNVECLPYGDKKFDTVICTHTLEHVQNLTQAISELRRVCKKRLIIVVPKQRPYKYTFDLHLNFFPYEHSFLQIMRNTNKKECKSLGDIFYVEECGGIE